MDDGVAMHGGGFLSAIGFGKGAINICGTGNQVRGVYRSVDRGTVAGTPIPSISRQEYA